MTCTELLVEPVQVPPLAKDVVVLAWLVLRWPKWRRTWHRRQAEAEQEKRHRERRRQRDNN